MKTSTDDKYLICCEENVVYKDIPSLPKTVWSRIKEIVKERFTLSPEKAGSLAWLSSRDIVENTIGRLPLGL